MRKNTPRQTKASRKNGSKGKGPTTPEGKKAVRFNSLKDGLFTKEIVIERAGERRKDFEKLKREVWKLFEPEDPLEEMLVTDLIEHRWRLQRVRRAESLELQKRLGLSAMRELLPSEEVQSLQARFLSCYEKYQFLSRSQRVMDALMMADELEDIRRQLTLTSGGVQFLIEQLRALVTEARSNGFVSAQNAILILACCGFGDEEARLCWWANSMIMKLSGKNADTGKTGTSITERDKEVLRLFQELKRSAEKFDSDAEKGSKPEDEGKGTGEGGSTPRVDPEESRRILVEYIGVCIRPLMMRKQLVSALEQVEKEARTAEAVVGPDRSDRYSRAETAIERRFYRALAMLLAVRGAASLGPSLPALPK